MPESVRGLFITGTDTDVGKTYVSALIVRARWRRAGKWASISQRPAVAAARGSGSSPTTP